MYERRRRPRSRRERVSPPVYDTTQHKFAQKKNTLLTVLLVVLMLIVGIGGWLVYVLYGEGSIQGTEQITGVTRERPENLVISDTSIVSSDRPPSEPPSPIPETHRDVLSRLSRHLMIESFVDDVEGIVIGQVSDPAPLRARHAFFSAAVIGDIVVNLGEIILLYRPSIDRIVNLSTDFDGLATPYEDTEPQNASTTVELSGEDIIDT